MKDPRHLTDYVATRWYRAPELLVGSTTYGPGVDVWAIGCILGELVDGQPLFAGDSEIDQLYIIQKIMGPLTPAHLELFLKNERFSGFKFPDMSRPEKLRGKYGRKLNKRALSFMNSLLQMDPKCRASTEACMQHPYFLPFTASQDKRDEHLINERQRLELDDLMCGEFFWLHIVICPIDFSFSCYKTVPSWIRSTLTHLEHYALSSRNVPAWPMASHSCIVTAVNETSVETRKVTNGKPNRMPFDQRLPRPPPKVDSRIAQLARLQAWRLVPLQQHLVPRPQVLLQRQVQEGMQPKRKLSFRLAVQTPELIQIASRSGGRKSHLLFQMPTHATATPVTLRLTPVVTNT